MAAAAAAAVTTEATRDSSIEDTIRNPHTFHCNLPSHHVDKNDGIPYVTKFCHHKARQILNLAHSIQLCEELFVRNDDVNGGEVLNNNYDDDGLMIEDNANNNGDDYDDYGFPTKNDTITSLMRKCTRLQSQFSTLSNLKYYGITQLELAKLALHLLRLVTATVTYTKKEDTDSKNKNDMFSSSDKVTAQIHYENVGYLFNANGNNGIDEFYTSTDDPNQLESELSQDFALPPTGREALLSLLISILSNKGPLASVSNSSLYPEEEEKEHNRWMMIIHWKVLLRMLLRTAPYLDEHKVGNPPSLSNSKYNTIVKRTVHLIRHSRHFFDQGIRPPNFTTSAKIDSTARDVWDMIKDDLFFHTHTHSCYRALILLYLFQPTKCTSSYYLELMPQWLEAWTSIDRCPEFDFLWLVMFCRGRKHVSPKHYNWTPVRKLLLTQCQYWLQIPVGGSTGGDKIFPRPGNPRTRACPSRLKVFVGTGSSYEEGIDFVAKVAKLVVSSIGTDDLSKSNESTTTATTTVSQGTEDILRFWSFVAPYFNPSNVGSWTFTLGAFLHYFSYEFCHRLGVSASLEALKDSYPNLAKALCTAEPSQEYLSIPSLEIVALLDALVPLCQQALYSKNGHVGRAGEAAMVYLIQIDPVHVAPPFLDFATRALDYSAVNLAHQAPAALSAMTRIVQPAIRRDPSILLSRLPEILRLSLAGIDSNDQNKTIRTLIFYRNLASWLPVGGKPDNWGSSQRKIDTNGVTKINDMNNDRDGTIHFGEGLVEKYLSKITRSVDYSNAMKELPDTSVLYQQQISDDLPPMPLIVEEASSALGDWSLAFLERIFALLRASGEREKTGKTASGVASRHSSADVQQARNFSRVMKECLIQVVAAMDDETHRMAVRLVAQFIEEETLPFAAKDASYLCQAIAGARLVADDSSDEAVACSPGLKALVPILTDDLQHHSNNTLTYRLRCLAGAIRNAGRAVLDHQTEISNAIDFALSSKDKHLLKTGCKLLRHTLASQCEAYPISSDNMPRCDSYPSGGSEESEKFCVGRSAYLKNDPIKWHVPNGPQIDYACSLLRNHVWCRIDDTCGLWKPNTTDDDSSMEIIEVSRDNKKIIEKNDQSSTTGSVHECRRTLRIIRYALRGGCGILLDNDSFTDESGVSTSDSNFVSYERENSPHPHERAVMELIHNSSDDTKASLKHLRGRICSFLVCLVSVIASETANENSKECRTLSTEGKERELSINVEKGIPSAISSDSKVCNEISDIALLLLTRRGANFRCQEAKTIWKAQKQLITDYLLASQTDRMTAVLHRSALYERCFGANTLVLYKDGEDGGKTVTRRLIVTRLKLFYESIQRNASFEIPRRFRRLARLKQSPRKKFIPIETSITEARARLSDFPKLKCFDTLVGYEALIDGLFALSCHSNTHVRSAGFGVIDYAVTRFGWLVPQRVPHLLSALQLADGDKVGKYGIPSCAKLSGQVDSNEKHKRLSEVIKGVCSISSLSRAVKGMVESESLRFVLVKTLCGTESLISLLPTEEMQKMVYYFHGIFSPFRSKLCSLPRSTDEDNNLHRSCLTYLMDILSNEDSAVLSMEVDSTDVNGKGDTTASSAHWRKRLLAGWFLTSFVDREDLLFDDPEIANRLWNTCFQLLEKEMGQPLQRVAVGLFGRLVSFALPMQARLSISLCNYPCCKRKEALTDSKAVDVSVLCDKMQEVTFCRVLGKAIVFDHKEDTSVGGGHQAQWSAGVDEILRDASSNVAPRTLFPFQRTSRSSNTFKIQHAQLIESLFLILGYDKAQVSAKHLLAFAREMAAAPPSEDQRNQHCTSAELFSGICRAMLQLAKDPGNRSEVWKLLLLPFLEDVIAKIPISLIGAFFDAFRFGIYFYPPSFFFDLTVWVTEKIESTLWQPSPNSESDNKGQRSSDGESGTELSSVESGSASGAVGSDGFTSQSKYLYLANAILVELDEEIDVGMLCRLPWYSKSLLLKNDDSAHHPNKPVDDLRQSWKLVTERLLPRLLEALGHPYETCREHIAVCLFRICYCHRKMLSGTTNRKNPGNCDLQQEEIEPGRIIVKKLASLETATYLTPKERYNSLITSRKFVAYCLHLGDAKHEYSELIIPLLPLSFDSLKLTVEESGAEKEDENGKEDAAKRSLEADVVKGFRYSIADVSSSAVISYGKDEDISRVLTIVANASKHEYWQVRHAATHFLRGFQGYHKFLFQSQHAELTTNTVAALLADERREVSSAAVAVLTGILAASPLASVSRLVEKYVTVANRSKIKRKKKSPSGMAEDPEVTAQREAKEKKRASNQQTSVFFLCASVLARPYDTPPYVPMALAALSKHSFEKSAPLKVRDVVKKCCAEFKRTHMSDNWEVHKKQFTQEQLEALEDVVSAPHYYA